MMIETRAVYIAGVAVKFVQCPVGAFEMGSNNGLPLEQPIRLVTIDSPFWISTTLVTQELWGNVMSENPSTFINSGALPVDGISYDGAIEFCSSATAATLAANPWGLFDIVGNLWEWCDDVWHSAYNDAPETDERLGTRMPIGSHVDACEVALGIWTYFACVRPTEAAIIEIWGLRDLACAS